ncbi:MAG: hypothetical protein ACM3O3_05180 [Syntrophothermus sp.]
MLNVDEKYIMELLKNDEDMMNMYNNNVQFHNSLRALFGIGSQSQLLNIIYNLCKDIEIFGKLAFQRDLVTTTKFLVCKDCDKVDKLDEKLKELKSQPLP